MNQISQERLKLVYPRLADKINQLSTRLAVEGIYIAVVQGLRTIAEQQAIFEQGRSAPGKIVTNAPGGHSWHNFGLSVDCAIENPDCSIDWNANHPQWKRMEQIGVSLGMTSGANWVRIVDAPHFQLTGRFPENAPTDEVRELIKSGIDSVWAEVEKTYQ